MPATPEKSSRTDPPWRLPILRTDRLADLIAVEQVRYVLVAGTTSLFYLALFASGIALGWHYMMAIAAAQGITIAAAFPAYRRLIFASRGRCCGDLIRFLSVWWTGMIAGFVATPALVELVGLPPLLAQTVSIVIVATGSYVGHRYISFRHRSERSGSEG